MDPLIKSRSTVRQRFLHVTRNPPELLAADRTHRPPIETRTDSNLALDSKETASGTVRKKEVSNGRAEPGPC